MSRFVRVVLLVAVAGCRDPRAEANIAQAMTEVGTTLTLIQQDYSFLQSADSLLVSGLLDNGSEMAGRAAVVDAPLGQGHVVLFGIRPMWRYETQGSYAMVLNALANWNALDTNERPQRVATDGARDRQ